MSCSENKIEVCRCYSYFIVILKMISLSSLEKNRLLFMYLLYFKCIKIDNHL